jgi:glycosyltransferase involved in cell wall biosynthesis
MSSRPVVSVIMNCYNSAQYLAESIDSVYAQTFLDWEIIFFDNASTDESPTIARRYDERLKYFRHEQTVPLGHARNLALKKAQGKYIAFLDCDDLWMHYKLSSQVELFEKDSDLGLVFSDAYFFSKSGMSFRIFPKREPPQGKIFGALLRRYFLPMPTIIIKRDVLDQVGGWFDERFHMVEDADLFMRIAYYFKVGYVHRVLAKRRMHENSWTFKKKELFPKEEEMLLDKFSSMWPSFTNEFSSEMMTMKAMIQYQYAVIKWEQGHNADARKHMKPYLSIVKKIYVPYIFSYLPYPIYKNFKNGLKSIMAPWVGSMDYQVF